jgi:hypothetical protein
VRGSEVLNRVVSQVVDSVRTANNNNNNNNNNNRNSTHVECENKSDTGNNMGEWNHFKITQTIPEQHTRNARNLRNRKKAAALGAARILRKVIM